MDVQHSRPEIQPEEIAVGKVIGEGTYGVVFEGVCRALPVAIKKPRKQTLNPAEREEILREISVMRFVRWFVRDRRDRGGLIVVDAPMQ